LGSLHGEIKKIMDIPLVCIVLTAALVILVTIVRSFLPYREGTTWEDLVKRHPTLQNAKVKIKANVDVVLIFLGLATSLGLMFVSEKHNTQHYLIIFLLIAMGYSYDGISILSESVYGIGSKGNPKFYYDKEKKFLWIAKLQTVASTLVFIIIAWLIFKKNL
jgi:hypothetical protein